MRPSPYDTGELELVQTVDGVMQIHGVAVCAGTTCVVHNPSDHPLGDAPLKWRGDRYLFERICEHGVGHPDPDSVAFLEERGVTHAAVHGCDGCC